MSDEQNYIPALKYHWLTRFYDPVMRLLPEDALFDDLVGEAALRPGDHVLDMGCGTGALTIKLAKSCPEADVVGIDIDPEVLEIARRKFRDETLDIDFKEGSASELPFDDDHFDVVTSSLVFHHLTPSVKRQVFAEIHRKLKPGGRLLIADWGETRSWMMRTAFLGVQLLDGFETTEDNRRGNLMPMMEDAGFNEVQEVIRKRTFLGVLALYTAVKPR